ncbi:hypothetical protein Fot_19843 [Forsythia ovata]|uniref:Uncharacterized protein n=1 Tax=Forsythia ovata TaxID=205694 RepID=A0ABD1VM65_9LAMI
MSGDVTPSMLTTKDQQTASVTPVIRRSPRHNTNPMESDRSKGKGIVNVPVKNRSLGVSGHLTPSILTIKEQHAVSVTPELMNGYIYYTCRGDCGIFVVKYVEYIFMKKINEMPNDFDTGLARHNMAVQLFKYSVEKPDIRLPGIC